MKRNSAPAANGRLSVSPAQFYYVSARQFCWTRSNWSISPVNMMTACAAGVYSMPAQNTTSYNTSNVLNVYCANNRRYIIIKISCCSPDHHSEIRSRARVLWCNNSAQENRSWMYISIIRSSNDLGNLCFTPGFSYLLVVFECNQKMLEI